MHSTKLRPLLLALFALSVATGSLSLAACGGDDDASVAPDATPATPDATPVVPDAGTGIALSDIAARLDQAYCDLDLRCHIAVSRDACLQGQTEYNPIPQLVADVPTGRVDYHADRAQACLDAVAASDCSFTTLTTMSEACRAIFTARVALDGSCFENEECTSGLCNSICGPDACCAGTCEASYFAPVGGPCSTTDDCQYDGYCPATSGGSATCVARLEQGATCIAGSDTCQLGLVCDGTCTRLPARGEACTPGAFLPCSAFDDFCAAASATCVERGLPGDACPADDDTGCVNYARCVNGTCLALALEGEDCTHNECYRGLDCGPASRCVKRPADPICE
jgi:hypothetical protein